MIYAKKPLPYRLICTPKVRQTFGGAIFMKRKKEWNTKYSPEFKIGVIMDMRENYLSYRETVRKYWHTKTRAEEDNRRSQVKSWERIYLEEGEAGFYIERRGRATKMDNPKKGRPRKKPLDKQVENDLIAELQKLKEENQYLRAENEYIKKLSA
jgi:transposase-like protein